MVRSLIPAWLTLTILAGTHSAFAGEGDEKPVFAHATQPCQKKEEWTFGSAFPMSLRDALESTAENSGRFDQQMSSAYRAKAAGSGQEFQVLNRYWIGRALWNQGLLPLAKRSFESALLLPSNERTNGVQAAALGCLNEIRRATGHLIPDAQIIPTLSRFSTVRLPKESLSAVREAIFTIARRATLEGRGGDAETQALKAALASLKGEAQLEYLRGLEAVKSQSTAQTVAAFERYFARKDIDPGMQSLNDEASLFLARAYYRLGRWSQASRVYKQIPKHSNWISDALTETAWTHLQSESYAGSIGIAADLLTSALAKTFAPEAPMILAMSFVELCQFPSAHHSIQRFRKQYRDAYKWLQDWNRDQSTPQARDLYAAVTGYLKQEERVPDAIGTEWLRSNAFLARQEEINWLRRSEKKTDQLLAEIQGIAKTDAAHSRLLAGLERFLRDYRSSVPGRVSQAVAAIRADLGQANARMLRTLSSVAQNNGLIEIEIFQGASQEMLWNQAHPDFKELAEQIQAGKIEPKKPGSTWDWGRSLAGDRATTSEVWEDELGSLRAHTENLCVKMKEFRARKN